MTTSALSRPGNGALSLAAGPAGVATGTSAPDAAIALRLTLPSFVFASAKSGPLLSEPETAVTPTTEAEQMFNDMTKTWRRVVDLLFENLGPLSIGNVLPILPSMLANPSLSSLTPAPEAHGSDDDVAYLEATSVAAQENESPWLGLGLALGGWIVWNQRKQDHGSFHGVKRPAL